MMKILFAMLKVRQDFHNSFTVALKQLPRTEVEEYNYLDRFRQLGRERMNSELIETVETYRPDIVLCIMYQDQIDKQTFKEMSGLGSVVAGWFCDDRVRFDDYSKIYAPCLDFSITTDAFCVPKYRALGCNPILTQWGSTPELFRPRAVTERIYDVSFIGGPHGGRTEYIKFLESKGIKINWFGKDSSNFLDIPGQNRVISSSKINLNFSGNGRYPHIKQIKTRFFEIPAAGGFLLSEYAPHIEQFYVLGKQIATFTSAEELLARIRHYLSHEKVRETIRNAGYRRAIREHTYVRRFSGILDIICRNHGPFREKRTAEFQTILRDRSPRECNDPAWIKESNWLEITLDAGIETRSYSYGKVVLDFCCGTGWCSQNLAKVAKTVCAVDSNVNAIEFAKLRHPGPQYSVMDALDLKYKDNTFDLIVFRESLEHFTAEEAEKLLEEISRVLKPEGMLFGTTPLFIPKEGAEKYSSINPYHKKEFSPEELRTLLSCFFSRVEVEFERGFSLRARFRAWCKWKRKQRLAAVVVLSCGNFQETERCLESIYKNTFTPVKVILVENGSLPSVVWDVEQLQQNFRNLTIHYLKENLGVGQGRLAGLRLAVGKYVIFLDNDMIVSTEGWIAKLIQRLESVPGAAVVGCRVMDGEKVAMCGGHLKMKNGTLTLDHSYTDLDRSDPKARQAECDVIHGGATLFKRGLFGEFTFPKEYFYGHEDCDFMLQIREAGLKILNSDVEVQHKRSVTPFERDLGQELAKSQELLRERWGLVWNA